MTCYSPSKAYRCADGSVVFAQLARFDIVGDITLACGQCIGCRLAKSQQWAIRCLHESKLHPTSMFLTLTYDEAHVPANGSLDHRHFQLFMKKLRNSLGHRVRYFMCGEYGELNLRPHYHALIFGHWFPDSYDWGKSPAGYQQFRSATLEKLWGLGHCVIGRVTKDSAGYCARYALKKITGDLAQAHYNGRTPEYARMSLKPGIGEGYFRQFHKDMLPNDYVIVDGTKGRMPTYYDRLFERMKGDLDQVKQDRILASREHIDNNTPERLVIREEVQRARIRSLSRGKA